MSIFAFTVCDCGILFRKIFAFINVLECFPLEVSWFHVWPLDLWNILSCFLPSMYNSGLIFKVLMQKSNFPVSTYWRQGPLSGSAFSMCVKGELMENTLVCGFCVWSHHSAYNHASIVLSWFQQPCSRSYNLVLGCLWGFFYFPQNCFGCSGDVCFSIWILEFCLFGGGGFP